MSNYKHFIALGVAFLGVVSSATAANALSLGTASSAAGFQNAFQLQGRYGDNLANANPFLGSTTVELGIRGSGTLDAAGNYVVAPVAPGGQQLTNNFPTNVTRWLRLSYTPGGPIQYKLANNKSQALNSNGLFTQGIQNGIGTSFDSILFDIDASAPGSSATLSGIEINGTAFAGSLSAEPNFLLLSDVPASGFNLVASYNFVYSGNPGADGVRFQVNVGTAIPTPALLPGLVGFGVAAWRKRKSEAVQA